MDCVVDAAVAPVGSRVPTVADARRAAEVLAAAGAGRVLLYGSVARGEQTPDSDIDLVAIFDDLGDYADRWERKSILCLDARAACGWPVQVLVTDRPEWRLRSERLRWTLERRIAPEAVPLVERPDVGVDWGKEIGMADSDAGEALDRLLNLRTQVTQILGGTTRWEAEKGAIADGDLEALTLYRQDRLWALCGAAQLCAENALKALIHVVCGDDPRRIHTIPGLADELPDRHWADVRGCFDDETWRTVSRWRVDAAYPADRPNRSSLATAGYTERVARHALAAAELAIDAYEELHEPCDESRRLRCHVTKVAGRLEADGVE